MNLNKYNTTTACNVAQTCSLRDPFTGELIEHEDGGTVDFYVYGIHSDRVRNALRDRDRNHNDKSKMTDEESAQAGAEFLAAAVSGWSEAVENDEGPIPYSHEAAVQLFLTQDWIAGQIRDFCFNLRNYDPKRLSASASGRARSRGITPAPKGKAKADTREQESA